MGFKKQYRPIVTIPAETLGSTSGRIGTFPPVTVITATATGLVYQLPVPISGLQKTVIVDWTGDTGNVVLANVSSETAFNGSTSNIITVTSSQEHVVIHLTGVSTSQWAVLGGVTAFSVSTSAAYASPISFVASTITS